MRAYILLIVINALTLGMCFAVENYWLLLILALLDIPLLIGSLIGSTHKTK